MSLQSNKPTELARTGEGLARPDEASALRHLLSGVRYEFIEDRLAEGIIKGKVGRSGHRGEGAAQWYEDMLSLLCRWVQGQEGVGHVEQLTRANLIHFLAHLREADRSDSYVEGHWRAMRTWLRWARKHYQLHASLFDPEDRTFTIQQPKVAEKEKPRYTEEQVNAIFDAIASKPARGRSRERDGMMIATYLGSACRLSEIAGLTLDAIEQDESGKNFLHVLGKFSKWRWVPISSKLRRDLERYIHRYRPQSKHANVFLTLEGTPLKARSIQSIFERIEKECGFRLHAHALRHHYAGHFMARPDANAQQLQKIMGHRSITTTMGYSHLNKADLAEGVDDFSPR